MHRLALLLLIFHPTPPSGAASLTSVTYDCTELRGRKLKVEIWSPENLRSLTIQNCDKLVLNITTGDEIESRLHQLTVRNVEKCYITGGEPVRSSLPRHANFSNVECLMVRAPLYGEGKFHGGVLQFTKVNFDRLKRADVAVARHSLEKFSMREVRVRYAEQDAIAFNGSSDSIFEIKDSIFHVVSGNFISCSVSRVNIQNNIFGTLEEGSLFFSAASFNSSGNVAILPQECGIRLHSQTQKNTYSYSNNSFNGIICVDVPVENKVESDLDENENEITSKTENINSHEGGEKVSLIVMRFGNRFLLLWFLALFLLVLIFPIAYFTKNFLCGLVDKAFPVDGKHKLLVNAEDI